MIEKITGEQIEDYIVEELGSEPRHDVNALASAINDIAEEVGYDSSPLMKLLLSNIAINGLNTHSYGFHTANGREIINRIESKYYGYKKFNEGNSSTRRS